MNPENEGAPSPSSHDDEWPALQGPRANLIICALLCLAVFLIYARTGGFDYISFDDGIFLWNNPTVQQGLTWQGAKYAFTDAAADSNYYIPMVWLSHMAVVSLFGMSPGAAHIVNMLLHMANVLLCFAAFFSLTGRRWESAFAAALFAVHPMHVESVAWVTERKDLLAGFFFMLTLVCYSRYAKKPGPGRYFITLLSFVLGLLSKPILVVLPCVLLLLDFWPLGRLSNLRSALKLGAEKLPFFIPVPIATFLAIHFQSKAGVLYTFAQYPFWRRVAAALTGYLIYLKKMLLPTDLCINYPYPSAIPAWQVAGAAAALLAVTAAAFFLRRRAPYFLVGWLWFLGVLFPVSGIFVIGDYAVADRYAYLSYPGLYLAMAMAGGLLVKKAGLAPKKAAAAAGALIAVMALSSALQAGYWKNSLTVFSRSASLTENNAVVLYAFGQALIQAGLPDEAELPTLKVMVLRPDLPDPWNNLGAIYNMKGDYALAEKLLLAALEINPRHGAALENLVFTRKRLAENAPAQPAAAAP